MSMYVCTRCDEWKDDDWAGCNSPDDTLEMFCDECWIEVSSEVTKARNTGEYADYARGLQQDEEGE